MAENPGSPPRKQEKSSKGQLKIAPLNSETAPPVVPVLTPPLTLTEPPMEVAPVPAPPFNDAVPAVDVPADVDPAVIEANPPSPVFPLPTVMVISPD